jgi:anti-sigma regulatory factor (Ser/Thr protein kinase)
MAETVAEDDCPIIALDKFVQATRDSGYKGTASAVSELVDNSLQAKASRIAVTLTETEGEHPIEVCVYDNGCGMDMFTLRQALRFGGSSRFGDRSGLGRYGMGLPNSSLSQAQRVTVFTWQSLDVTRGRSKGATEAVPEGVYSSYLDLDEIARGELEHVPKPRVVLAPPSACRGPSGTVVVWQRCDRLDNRRVSTLARKLASELGRRFRHFIWKGIQLTINGRPVEAVDPLFLHNTGSAPVGQLFGEELEYEVMVDSCDPGRGTGVVRVRFSELPVHEWQRLSNDEKRALGISKGAGVSVVRAGREVDYGWFLMGEKRRENYDDWWRCEIQFDPILDEAFGITHTKQQVRPQVHLVEALTPDLESTARVLNGRVRQAHLQAKVQERSSQAEEVATQRDQLLRPLGRAPEPAARKLMAELKRKHPSLKKTPQTKGKTEYSIVESPIRETTFFTYAYDGERVVLVVNSDHPFYAQIYKPLADSESSRDKELRARLDLLLLAAVRSEAATGGRRAETLAKHRLEWSNTLAAYLNG